MVIQQGGQAKNKNLSKEEYEKVLIHGASTIMKQKVDKVNLLGEIDIDQLIDEGTRKHRALKEEAEKQVDQMQADGNFDFNMEAIDTFKF